MLKKIAVKDLTVGMFVQGFDEAWLHHPFWRSRFLIRDEAQLREIRQSGIEGCWIDPAKGRDCPASPVQIGASPAPPPAAEGVANQATAQPATDRAPTPDRTPPPGRQRVPMSEELRRAERLRERSAHEMRRMFQEARLGNAVEPEQCAPLVDDVVESINRHPDALLSLLRLKNADEYTYLHSVAVCALMVALGRQLGLDEAECREAGMAGMLHDLGKAAVPQEILNKPGKLTAEEFEIIKLHPVRGYEMLLEAGHVSDGVKDVCRHHHERMDGTGYPDRLPEDRISLLARMGAVCDVYDAVTSDRPYKAGWDPAHALSQMASWAGHFDPAIFQSFVKSVGIYPIGSLVRMRSGRLAIVIEQNPAALTRPRVKIFFSTKSGLPLEPRVLDLAARPATDQIEGREPPEKWNFPYLRDLWTPAEARAP